jgi:hypothetical protein
MSSPAPVADTRIVDRAGIRLGLIAAALVLALVGGFAVGRAVSADAAAGSGVPPHTHAPGTADDGHAHGSGAGAGGEVTGLSISAGGYTFAPAATTFAAGQATPFTFRVLAPDGRPVTRYVTAHDRQLHLIVARRDLGGYQHLHPTLAADGTWAIPLTLPTPGSYRAYADFVTLDAGDRQVAATLAVDLTVPGDVRPVPLPAPATSASADPFTVTYEGSAEVGATRPLTLQINRGGDRITPERYLAAYGHLVVLREGDLAYLHVHPEDQLIDRGVKFWLAAPSPGRYRAYFDFQVDGRVHTAEFTLQLD